jgi:glycosyltransferase involved in cell wall biosynthesis
MRVAVVVPTYDERENLAPLVERLLALPAPLHVIVVDDASPDGTGELAEELARRDDRVHVVHRPGKLGLGTAYRAGFELALAEGADLLVTMDADLSHDPATIPHLLDAAARFDVTVGSRYVPGGRIENWPPHRRLLSAVANRLTRTVLGLSVHDATTGFRCYRREVLERVGLDRIVSDGYSFLIEMIFLCDRAGYRIGEVPIVFRDRTRGASKISGWEIGKAVLSLLRLRIGRPAGPPP